MSSEVHRSIMYGVCLVVLSDFDVTPTHSHSRFMLGSGKQ